MMKQAHRRIVASIGAESFESNVIERFGLVVTELNPSWMWHVSMAGKTPG